MLVLKRCTTRCRWCRCRCRSSRGVQVLRC